MQPVRLDSPGLHLRGFAGPNRAELTAVALPLATDTPGAVVQRLREALAPYAAKVVKADVFGALGLRSTLGAELQAWLGDVPVTWVAGEGCGVEAMAGLTVQAVTGDPARVLWASGKPVGVLTDDGECTWLWLGDLHPAPAPQRPADQAKDLFDQVAEAIRAAGLPSASLARTWFYFENLLSWYGDFNAARTHCFVERGWLAQLPASTGIDAANAHGSALVGGALAVAPTAATASVQVLESPMQGPAPAYGSSFSRAVEVRSAGLQRVWISGTASIDRSGVTAHAGDLEGQISLTFAVIRALLRSRSLDWPNVTRAVAYVDQPKYAGPLRAWLARENLQLPLVICRAGICRDNLLVEVELDAAMAT